MKPHPTVDTLLAKSEAFCKKHGLAQSRFGRLAVNDGNFLRALRLGARMPRLETIDKVRAFMKDYKSQSSRS